MLLRPERRFAVVAAPAYVARHGSPTMPDDLAGNDCICRRYPSDWRYAWEFARGGKILEIEVSGRIVTNDPGLMRAAAFCRRPASARVHARRRRGARGGQALYAGLASIRSCSTTHIGATGELTRFAVSQSCCIGWITMVPISCRAAA